MKELRMYIVFKDSAKIGSINGLLRTAITESNGRTEIQSIDITQNQIVLRGFDGDPAIRRRAYHEINSRYHNMIQSISEVDV